ncbi:MAG TPA: helix-turn-helix domain-containing protein [Steroidobacteraceae bacterium]|jgi:Predicted transcriptional regulators|nr:helix-turn-helix domain-containing protein [Steroidobacteraceae bacterium]
MTDGSSMVAAATLIGDYARAKMLTALMGGRALTATELAGAAGITKQTGSTHLRKLLDARFVAMEAHGRHRYFRIADEEVAQLLEGMMSFSVRGAARMHATGPKDPALRKARVCYDHLAGELGVLLYASLHERQAFEFEGPTVGLSAAGERLIGEFGVNASAMRNQKRALCRICMDWSERRHHLAGAVGAALLTRVIELGWAARDKSSRAVCFRPNGERQFRNYFALNGDRHAVV